MLAIAAWLLRAPIAETLIGLYFKEQGIVSDVTISRLEWSGLAGRFALGDARMPTVSADAHAVIEEAKAAGVYVFGGGIDEQVAPVLVAADGSVQNAHVTASEPSRVFDREAVRAVQQAKFEPKLENGQAVASTLRRRIEFKLGN